MITQACLLLLQTVFLELEEFPGASQAGLFQKDLLEVFRQRHFLQADSPKALNHLLTLNPLTSLQVPSWEEHYLITLLQELLRLGKEYFGNTHFAEGVRDTLQDMPDAKQTQFLDWLK